MDTQQAELLGMHAGDGTLYRTNGDGIVWELRGGVDEKDYYDQFVAPLFKNIFDVEFFPKHRSGAKGSKGSYGIQTCNKELVKLLSPHFPIGAKSHIIRIPDPIMNGNKTLKCAFLRGLFDTDGCVRFDKVPSTGKPYPRIKFSTASKAMWLDVQEILSHLRLRFYTWISKSKKWSDSHKICINGKNNKAIYSDLISSSNPKHLNKLYL